MPRSYPLSSAIRRWIWSRPDGPAGRRGSADAQPAIYVWIRQDRIDAGLEPGLSSCDDAKLVAARRRIAALETELEVTGRRSSWRSKRCPQKAFRSHRGDGGEGLWIKACRRVLGASESGFRMWRKRPPSPRAIRHAWLTEQIRRVHADSQGTYGGQRVHAELTLGLGVQVGHGAVAMLMRRASLRGLPSARQCWPIHQIPTAADLVDRQFIRTNPDELWVTEITERPTREGDRPSESTYRLAEAPHHKKDNLHMQMCTTIRGPTAFYREKPLCRLLATPGQG